MAEYTHTHIQSLVGVGVSSVSVFLLEVKLTFYYEFRESEDMYFTDCNLLLVKTINGRIYQFISTNVQQ